MLALLAYQYANQNAKNAFTFSKVKTCHFWPLDKAILCYDTAYRTFLMHHHHHDKNEAATQFLWQCSSPNTASAERQRYFRRPRPTSREIRLTLPRLFLLLSALLRQREFLRQSRA